MIEGMKFHVLGKELSGLMAARVSFHRGRVEELIVLHKTASDAMEVAAKAAEGAGAATGRKNVPVARVLAVASMRSHSSGPSRQYGEEIEDPVSAIEQSITFHRNQATKLDFYAKHLKAEEEYQLTENDLVHYEIYVLES